MKFISTVLSVLFCSQLYITAYFINLQTNHDPTRATIKWLFVCFFIGLIGMGLFGFEDFVNAFLIDRVIQGCVLLLCVGNFMFIASNIDVTDLN